MKVKVKIEIDVDIPISSFDEIDTKNMSIEESNELIERGIYYEYGFIPDRIIAVNPYKK